MIQSIGSKIINFLGYVPIISTPIGIAQYVHGYATKKFCEQKASTAPTKDIRRNFEWKAYEAKNQMEIGIITLVPFGKLFVVKIFVPLISKAFLD